MEESPRGRGLLRVLLASIYLVAGVGHFVAPHAFVQIVPNWVPFAHAVVLVTGVCEIAGAAGLLMHRWRKWAGVMLALYAICVFPANVKHSLEGIHLPPLPDSWWYHGPRLAFQPVLVWWALFCAGMIDWPWRRPPAMPDATPPFG